MPSVLCYTTMPKHSSWKANTLKISTQNTSCSGGRWATLTSRSLSMLASNTVPIESFGSRSLEVIQTILPVVQEEDEVFIASFVEANINASGENQLDAVEMLKDMIASSFRLLVRKEPVLGEEPRRQLGVLRRFVRER
jgi:hypothetical protein